MSKIAFFEIKPWEEDYLKKELKDFDASFFTEKLSIENANLVKDSQIVCIFVDSQINKELLTKLPNVKIIVTRSTGFDHIDINEAKKNKILVCNIPHYGDNSVAEHAFALILDLSRKIHDSIEKVKKEGFSARGLTGFDLKGKTIGIVGLGNIGKHVARIARGFEMNILACDEKQDKKLMKELKFKYVSLEDILRNSDIITLHIPLNDKTSHIINSENINLIKRGAYLINTSRGGIVETEALLKALDDKILAGAGLDVLEQEPLIKEESQLLSSELSDNFDFKTLWQGHVLMEKENVIVTPHNAFNSKEALDRILEVTVLNIKSFINNKPINYV